MRLRVQVYRCKLIIAIFAWRLEGFLNLCLQTWSDPRYLSSLKQHKKSTRIDYYETYIPNNIGFDEKKEKDLSDDLL